MTAALESPATRRRLIGLLGGLFAFFAVLLLPAPASLDAEAQRTAAVAALMICWWISEAVHIGVTGLVPLALFPLLGVASSREVSPHYANHLIFLFVGGFVIAHAMETWDLHRRIALGSIARFGSRPRRLVLGFMVTTAALSMWISNTATTMMLLPVAMAVVNQLATAAEVRGVRAGPDATKVARETLGCVLLLGIAYSASVGGLGTIVGSPTNVAFLGFASDALPDLPAIGFFQWSLICLPIVAAFLPIIWLYLCRYGGSVPLKSIRFTSTQSVIRDQLKALGPITPPEKRVMAVASTTGLLWIFRSPLELGSLSIPGWAELFPVPGHVHDSTVAIAMALLLFVLPCGLDGAERSRRLLGWKATARGIPWGIVFLIGGGFALAAMITQSGLASWVGSWLGVLGGVPPWGLVAAICLLTTAMTETTSNVATVLMLSPAIAAMAADIGVHPYLLLFPMAVTSSFAFTMPVATPPNAIIFSSGWIRTTQMFRAGVVLDAIGLLLVPAAAFLLGSRLWGGA